jgi:putative membrane protein
MFKRRRPNYAKGALAGIAGGLVASFAMNQFQGVLAKAMPHQRNGSRRSNKEPATVKIAETLSRRVFDHELAPKERARAGNAVHYAFGAATGALYGVLAEAKATSRLGFGTLFGSVLWFVADEIVVPRLGLSGPASDYTASTHASSWASHLVYGITTDLVRRGVRAI